jgi:DNA-binding CsgD family transcriptional regulator
MSQPEPNDVLDAIYDAATEPRLWPRALEKFGDWFGDAGLIAGIQEIMPVLAAATDLNPELLAAFLAVFRDRGLIAPIDTALRQGSKATGARTIEEITFWFKHLARATRLTGRIVRQDWERRGLRATLDRLHLGVVLIGPDDKIVLMNSAAEEIVRAKDGLCVTVERLVVERPQERGTLLRLIAAACARDGRGGGSMAVSRPSGAPAYGIEVRAVSQQWDLGAIAAAFVTDPQRRSCSSVEQAVALLGLTPAEARLALRLAEGVSLVTAAEQCGCSINTAKTLLQRAFAKTHTRRQSELVHLIRSTLPELR